MAKRKATASNEPRPSKRAHVVDDDGDQNISDDGEIPVFNGADDESEDEDMDDDGFVDLEAEDQDNEDASATNLPGPSSASFPPEKASGWKAPTTEEVAEMREATELFKSSAFKLQIEALLPQVQPKASATSTLEPLLHALYQHIASIPSQSPETPLQAAAKLQKKGVSVLYPFPEPTEQTKYKVSFEKPSNIQVVGSWPHHTTVLARDGVGFSVDLAIEMPSTLFQEKDYLDSRFFHKRAYYLAVIAASIASSDLGIEPHYESPEGNIRRTALILRPTKGKHTFKKLNASIRIILTLPSGAPIPVSRLSPTHSNIRTSSSPSSPTPTPLYNSDLLLHTTPTPHLLQLFTATKEIPSFKEALILLRVWANQRGYGRSDKVVSGFEGLGGAWWGFVLAYLVWGDDESTKPNGKGVAGSKVKKARRTIGRGLSSYQMFRAAMDFFANHDFLTDPVVVKTVGGMEAPHFNDAVSPSFVGSGTVFNFLAGVPAGSLALLRHDARLTLQVLDSPSSSDSFNALFMRDMRSSQARFDTVIRVNISNAILPGFSDATSYPPDSPSRTHAIVSALDTVLNKALDNRAKLIAICHPFTSSSYSVSYPSSLPSTSILEIGLILDPENAARLVDHGPPAEDPEAGALFRSFWGEVAELRRFNDGRIVESIVWDSTGKTAEERALQIPGKIVRYIVGHQLKIPAEDVLVFNEGYHTLLSRSKEIITAYTGVAGGLSAEALQRAQLAASDAFVKTIKAMEDLPISVVSATPVSENLRYTAVFPPLPLSIENFASLPDSLKHIPVTEVILQFERSNRWPDDLETIQSVKVALFDAIAQALPSGTQTSIAWDRQEMKIEDHTSLEVLLTSGFAFRLRINHDREQTLLENIISDTRGVPEYKRKEASNALAHYQRRFVQAPAHHAAIHALHHRHPSYSHTTRLVKRWIAAHWLSLHIPSELIELVCAHVYLDESAGYDPPFNAPTGFARAVALLSTWDWRETPLVVPLYSASGIDRAQRVRFPAESAKRVAEELTQARATDPAFSKGGAWIVATEQDLSGRAWSERIDGVIAARVREIAKATSKYLVAGMDSGVFDVKAMYSHPTQDYDFLIHLNPAVIPRYSQNLSPDSTVWGSGSKYANLAVQSKPSVYGSDIRLDFDPVHMFITDVQKAYGDSVMFFYDSYGGTTIGGIFNPSLHKPRPFRVLLGFSSKPVDPSKGITPKDAKKLHVALNEAAILSEIQRLGQGLVQKVEVQKNQS